MVHLRHGEHGFMQFIQITRLNKKQVWSRKPVPRKATIRQRRKENGVKIEAVKDLKQEVVPNRLQ